MDREEEEAAAAKYGATTAAAAASPASSEGGGMSGAASRWGWIPVPSLWEGVETYREAKAAAVAADDAPVGTGEGRRRERRWERKDRLTTTVRYPDGGCETLVRYLEFSSSYERSAITYAEEEEDKGGRGGGGRRRASNDDDLDGTTLVVERTYRPPPRTRPISQPSSYGIR